MDCETQRGPFHVITFERDHGGLTNHITYNNVDDLLKGIHSYLSDELKYEFCDANRDICLRTEMEELDAIFGEENVDIDQLIRIMIRIGREVSQEEYGIGWDYVLEGGRFFK